MRAAVLFFCAVAALCVSGVHAKQPATKPKQNCNCEVQVTEATKTTVRAELKAIYDKRTPADRQLTITKAASGVSVTCPAKRRTCFIPVRVDPVTLGDGTKTCKVTSLVDMITVKRVTGLPKTLVIWYLDSGTDVDNEYQFNEIVGIDLKDYPTQYTTQDFDDPGHHLIGRMFKWKSVNSRDSLNVNYEINVEMKDESGHWSPCKLVDPIIVNTG